MGFCMGKESRQVQASVQPLQRKRNQRPRACIPPDDHVQVIEQTLKSAGYKQQFKLRAIRTKHLKPGYNPWLFEI